jgi:3-deoxy-D-manno-octulosonic-acid transferase
LFILYDILSAIALLFYLPTLLTKKGPENRLTFIKERLGLSRYSNADVWVHAVSVGEVMAAIPLLKALKKEYPQKKFLVTTITYTGQRVAKEKFPEADRIMYMPYDNGLGILNKVVAQIKPELFITIETELWPALFYALKRHGSKILVMNGRLSASSTKGYSRVKFFMRKLLSFVDAFGMQDNVYANRVLMLGAPKDKVEAIGSFKFDITMPPLNESSWTWKLQKPILSVGSAHRGEDRIIIQAFKTIQSEMKGVKMIFAPRHPERFDEVEELFKTESVRYIRRSQIDPLNPEQSLAGVDAVLLDTIGELSQVYACSDIAFVAGSLVPIGGHNILEPAYWAKPILTGPYMDNFPIVEDFLQNNALIQVKNETELANAAIALLKDRRSLEEMGKRARQIIDKNIGAVSRGMSIIKRHLS